MHTQAPWPVASLAPALDDLCEMYHVRQLDLFGSAARGAFDPARSDLDLLVSFLDEPGGVSPSAYFDFLEALTALFGRYVALVMEGAVENPYLLHTIERDRVPVFRAK